MINELVRNIGTKKAGLASITFLAGALAFNGTLRIYHNNAYNEGVEDTLNCQKGNKKEDYGPSLIQIKPTIRQGANMPMELYE